MKRIPPTVYVWSMLAGLVVMFLVSISTYVGGYFLLADQKGLFPSEGYFKLYEPAVRVQRWATGKPVNTGYVDPIGRRFAKRLP